MVNDNDSILALRVQLLEQEVKKLQAIVRTFTKEKPQQHGEQEVEDAILNLEEAHKLLKLPPHVVYMKSKSGELPSFKIGKQYRFKRVELMAWKQMQEMSKKENVDDYVNSYLQNNIRNR